MKVRLGDVCDKASSSIIQKSLEGHEGKYPIYGASGLIKYVDFYQREKPYIAVVKDGAGIGRVMKLPAYSSVIGTMQYIIPNEKVDINYLVYSMEYMNLAKYFSGATIPHIYFRDYQKEPLNLPEIKVQKKIGGILSNIEKLIAFRNQELSKFDQLVKSRFIELFGDPVSNGKFWNLAILQDVTSKIGSGATPKGGKSSYQKEGIPFIRSMNVHDGVFLSKDLAYLSDKQAKQLENVIVKENDVLLNITGASVARSCIVPKTVIPARVNQHVSIIRCIPKYLNPEFLNKLFLHHRYKNLLLSLGEAGGATRQAITKSQLEKLQIILPPLTLQNEFADFVQQVDKSKLAVQKSLEKLEILKKSLMQQYFG